MTFFTNIICTKDRPGDLSKLLNSLQKQVKKPDCVLIVDGSDSPIEYLLKDFPELNFKYLSVRPPGLTKQRNAGLMALPTESEWVGFLDDDLVLEPEAILNLDLCIQKNPEVRGIGLVINNQPVFKRENILRNIFFTDAGAGGVVTRSGFAACIRPVKKDLDVEWLYGGATFWKKEIFSEYLFDEWYSGVGYLDDVDFSYRVSRKHRLMLCASAKCFHYPHPVKKEKLYALGTWHLVAWWYFIGKHNSFNRFFVLWSMMGIFFSNLMFGVLYPSTNRFKAALGNLNAFRLILLGRASRQIGFQK